MSEVANRICKCAGGGGGGCNKRKDDYFHITDNH